MEDGEVEAAAEVVVEEDEEEPPAVLDPTDDSMELDSQTTTSKFPTSRGLT